MDADEAGLANKEKALIRIFMASAFHRWDLLPGPHPLHPPSPLLTRTPLYLQTREGSSDDSM